MTRELLRQTLTFTLNPGSGVPPYLQVVQQVEQALRMGHVQPGDKLPTVKQVVAELAINPNTVFKAYRELENLGLVEGRQGVGTFVLRRPQGPPPSTQARLARSLERWITSAQSEGLDDAAIDLLFKSAALHDIGKVGIPDHILLKPGKLDADKFAVMKTHTDLGSAAIANAERLLGESSAFLRKAQEIVHTHHEKWDGTGYPRGLKGVEIPLSGRLMAIADVYDALVSKRVYKSALSHAEALDIIVSERGRHFDPELVDVFAGIAGTFESIHQRFADASSLPNVEAD